MANATILRKDIQMRPGWTKSLIKEVLGDGYSFGLAQVEAAERTPVLRYMKGEITLAQLDRARQIENAQKASKTKGGGHTPQQCYSLAAAALALRVEEHRAFMLFRGEPDTTPAARNDRATERISLAALDRVWTRLQLMPKKTRTASAPVVMGWWRSEQRNQSL